MKKVAASTKRTKKRPPTAPRAIDRAGLRRARAELQSGLTASMGGAAGEASGAIPENLGVAYGALRQAVERHLRDLDGLLR